MKSKGYSDIKARVPRVGIWCCGKVIHSLRLAGSLYPISSMLPSSLRNTCARSPRVEEYSVERSRRSDMRLESPWIYHGPAERGWDGLGRGGRVCCGGKSRTARRTCGGEVYMREPHQPASRNRAIRWAGDTMTLFCRSFDISYFLFLLVGFRV